MGNFDLELAERANPACLRSLFEWKVVAKRPERHLASLHSPPCMVRGFSTYMQTCMHGKYIGSQVGRWMVGLSVAAFGMVRCGCMPVCMYVRMYLCMYSAVSMYATHANDVRERVCASVSVSSGALLILTSRIAFCLV